MLQKFYLPKFNIYNKKKNLHKYLIISTSLIIIFFSFFYYKFFFFKTKKKYFFSEYLKINFFYFFLILLNYLMLKLLIDKININIYLTQFILITINIILSIIINFKFIFKK